MLTFGNGVVDLEPEVISIQNKIQGVGLGGYTNVNVSCVINLSQALLTEEEPTTFSGRVACVTKLFLAVDRTV